MSYEESSSSSSFYQSSSGGNEFGDGEFDLFFSELSFETHTNPILTFIILCIVSGGYGIGLSGGVGGAAQGGYSSYESSSAAGYGAGAGGALQAGGGGASGEYYSSSSSGGLGAGALGAGAQASSSGSEFGYGQQGLSGVSLASGAGYGASSFEQQSSSSTVYATDAQGLYKDPNPEVIRRPAPGGAQTYTQKIVVRFLQPPPVPPPGVSILKSIGV
jgi:hypothetical protein